ncbi:hypothetical protein C8R43DRAFT_1228874 [Mycena crocata]|nr:hypothetical protein C8R43DRAFT_1228874 [Mycena crocata]
MPLSSRPRLRPSRPTLLLFYWPPQLKRKITLTFKRVSDSFTRLDAHQTRPKSGSDRQCKKFSNSVLDRMFFVPLWVGAAFLLCGAAAPTDILAQAQASSADPSLAASSSPSEPSSGGMPIDEERYGGGSSVAFCIATQFSRLFRSPSCIKLLTISFLCFSITVYSPPYPYTHAPCSSASMAPLSIMALRLSFLRPRIAATHAHPYYPIITPPAV